MSDTARVAIDDMPIGARAATAAHLVSLTSVEDDGFGEGLSVFWEVEPENLVLPKATLPRPLPGQLDVLDRLAAFLDAVRRKAIASAEEYQGLMAACDNDDQLDWRVQPFWQLLRTALRGLPMEVLSGGLSVTKTSDRRDSGAAYTTKELADEVVRYALDTLVYAPSPREGAAPEQWRLRSAKELLPLKVGDPAVESGAILVVAGPYLADQLVEAWHAEVIDLRDADDVTLRAGRTEVDHCLYGVARNPMAVEMARLSLWLTTLAKDRPFMFPNHQVRTGDALLGIRTLDQVRRVHIDPDQGLELHAFKLFDPARDVHPREAEAVAATQVLDAIEVINVRDVEGKQRLHTRMLEALASLAVVADAAVGAALLGRDEDVCVDTFPFPHAVPSLEDIGTRVHEHRTRVTCANGLSLPKTYNRFNDKAGADVDIALLRDPRAELDRAVADAYGWTDLALHHGVHDTREGIRVTVGTAARQEALDRLLELNSQRCTDEVVQGSTNLQAGGP